MLQDQRDLKGERKPYKTILKVTFVFLLAIFLWKVFVSVATNPGPLPELPGLIDLQKATTFDKADKALQDAGFSVVQNKLNLMPQTYTGMYQPKDVEIYGQTPALCGLIALEDATDGVVMIDYYFQETADSTLENPGEVFTALRNGLQESLKKKPEESVQDGMLALIWQLNKNAAAALFYAQDGTPMLIYMFSR